MASVLHESSTKNGNLTESRRASIPKPGHSRQGSTSLKSGENSPFSSVSSPSPSIDDRSTNSDFFHYDPTVQEELMKDSGTIEKPVKTEWKPSADTEYETLQSLRIGERFEANVTVFEGILSKKRRRRGTGHQKRFCRLDEGHLLYAKNKTEMDKSNILGKLDIALSVVTLNAKKRGIEIDSYEAVHHFRVANDAQFLKWAQHLRDHRLYRQAKLAQLGFSDITGDGTLRRDSTLNETTIAGRRLGLDVSKAQLDAIFQKMDRLASLVEQWDTAAVEQVPERDPNPAAEGSKKATIKKFFSRRKKGERKDELNGNTLTKASNVTRTSTMDTLQLPTNGDGTSPASPNPSRAHSKPSEMGSQTSLNKESVISGPTAGQPQQKLADTDALLIAREVLANFRVIGNDFRQLYNRFNDILYDGSTLKSGIVQSRIVQTLSSDSAGTIGSGDTFFTAISHFSGATLHAAQAISDTSSERDSRDEGMSTDSEMEENAENLHLSSMQLQTGRRTSLPSVRPPADGSLLKMIGGCIGKDLTRLALPVKINEPLSMLQRLCEELEYCELLDKAAESSDPVERMTLVATFAVSSFASSYYRASTKPFNPLLGETYECVREDKGFRFVAEQVSHHPPISACHAESLSEKYCYWQDFRPKTRFWGRSIEITNHGEVHVTINKEHYQWNKPSSRVAISAIMQQKGHLDVYGTVRITCSNNYSAQLTFGKSSSGATPVHVEGSIHGPDKAPLTALFGSWNECVYWNDPGKTGTRVLWRAGAMPADHERFYGFTRFAIELNELTDDLANSLPPTDSRFRPDQRLLECGNLVAAEMEKKRVEQQQRDRLTKYTKDHYPYEPRWFRRVEQTPGSTVADMYEYNYRYWSFRENPGFANMTFDGLW